MVLKGYFDGGNQADSTQYDRVTLGVASGTGEQWRLLETAWNAVREKHNAPPLHTTDAIGLHNDFSSQNGWDDRKVDLFIDDCVGLVEQHILISTKLPASDIPVELYESIERSGLNISEVCTLRKG